MTERFFNTCTHGCIRHNLPGTGEVGPGRIRSPISKHMHLESLTWRLFIAQKVNRFLLQSNEILIIFNRQQNAVYLS